MPVCSQLLKVLLDGCTLDIIKHEAVCGYELATKLQNFRTS